MNTDEQMNNQVHCSHTDGIVEVHKQCISTVPIFNHLTTAEMNEIVKETHSIAYQRGQTIYRAGEPSVGLYIVHKGRVKIYRITHSGKEQVVRLLGPGDFTGELSLFNQSVHDAYADAIEPVELCVMGRDEFQNFLLKYPAISLKVLTEFSTRLAQTEDRAVAIALESTDTRIAMYLANQSEAVGCMDITLEMSRKDLASHLGTTPETVSRKLTEFEQAGWIHQRNQREIDILDLDALLLV